MVHVPHSFFYRKDPLFWNPLHALTKMLTMRFTPNKLSGDIGKTRQSGKFGKEKCYTLKTVINHGDISLRKKI